eukprot:PhM_4_TR16750/c1_g1_i2/m.26789
MKTTLKISTKSSSPAPQRSSSAGASSRLRRPMSNINTNSAIRPRTPPARSAPRTTNLTAAAMSSPRTSPTSLHRRQLAKSAAEMRVASASSLTSLHRAARVNSAKNDSHDQEDGSVGMATLPALRQRYQHLEFRHRGCRVVAKRIGSDVLERRRQFRDAVQRGNVYHATHLMDRYEYDHYVRAKTTFADAETPLMIAVRGHHVPMVMCLLERGADITFSTHKGSALMVAREPSHRDMLDVLLTRYFHNAVAGSCLDLTNLPLLPSESERVVSFLLERPEIVHLKMDGFRGRLAQDDVRAAVQLLASLPTIETIDFGQCGRNSATVYFFMTHQLEVDLGLHATVDPTVTSPAGMQHSFNMQLPPSTYKIDVDNVSSCSSSYSNPEPDLLPVPSFAFDADSGLLLESSFKMRSSFASTAAGSLRSPGSPFNSSSRQSPKLRNCSLRSTNNIDNIILSDESAKRRSFRDLHSVTLDGVLFEQEFFIDVAQLPLHFLLSHPSKSHKRLALNLLLKMIFNINSQSEAGYETQLASRVDGNGWTLLRHAVDGSNLSVVEGIMGKGFEGLLPHTVHSKDRDGSYVYEEFTDVWKANTPCKNKLTPLQAAIIGVSSRPLFGRSNTSSCARPRQPCSLPNCHCRHLPVPASNVCGTCNENAANLSIVRYLITHGVLPRTVTKNGTHIQPGDRWRIPYPSCEDGPKPVEHAHRNAITRMAARRRASLGGSPYVTATSISSLPRREYRFATCFFDRVGVGMTCFGRSIVLLLLQYAPSLVKIVLPSENFTTLPPHAQVIDAHFLHTTERIPHCGKIVDEVQLPIRCTASGNVFETTEFDVGMRLQHWAALRGATSVLQLMVKDAVDVFKRSSHLCWTTLHYACYGGHLDTVNYIISVLRASQCDLSPLLNDQQSRRCDTPLHCATANGHVPVVERLIQVGAKSLLQNKEGLTPFDVAVVLRKTHAAVKSPELLPTYARGREVVDYIVKLYTATAEVTRHLHTHASRQFYHQAGVYVVFSLLLTVLAHLLFVEAEPHRQFYGFPRLVHSLREVHNTDSAERWVQSELSWFIENNIAFWLGKATWQPNPLNPAHYDHEQFVNMTQTFQFPTIDSSRRVAGTLDLENGNVHLTLSLVMSCSATMCFNSLDSNLWMLYEDLSWSTLLVHVLHCVMILFTYVLFREEVMDMAEAYREVRALKEQEHKERMQRNEKIKKLQNAKNVLQLLAKASQVETSSSSETWKPKSSSYPQVVANAAEVRRRSLTGNEAAPPRLLSPSFKPKAAPPKIDTTARTLSSEGDGESSCRWDRIMSTMAPLSPRKIQRSVQNILEHGQPENQPNPRKAAAAMTAPRQRHPLLTFVYERLSLDADTVARLDRQSAMCQRRTEHAFEALMSYLSREWNSVDLICVVLWLCYFALYLHGIVLWAWRWLFHDTADPDYTRTMINTWRSTTVLMMILVLTWLKLLKYIEVLPHIGSVTTAIVSTVMHKNISLFLILVGVLVNAFMVGFGVLLRGQAAEFSTVGSSYLTVLRMMLGESHYDAIHSATSPLIGTLLFLFFLLFANMVMLNIFVAMVSQLYQQSLHECSTNWVWRAVARYQDTIPELKVETGVISPLVLSVLPERFSHQSDDLHAQIGVALENSRTEYKDIISSVKLQQRQAAVDRAAVSLESEKYEVVSLQAQLAAELHLISEGGSRAIGSDRLRQDHAMYSKLERQFLQAKTDFDCLLETATKERDDIRKVVANLKSEFLQQNQVEKELRLLHEVRGTEVKATDDTKKGLVANI